MAYTSGELDNVEEHADSDDIGALVAEIRQLYTHLDAISGLCAAKSKFLKSESMDELRSAASELAHIHLIAEEARGRVPDPGN